MKIFIKNIVKLIILVFIAIVLIVGGYLYWQYYKVHPSTDNAYINANIVNIAAQVSGPVTNIYTSNYAFVKKGELLFSIDPKPFEIAVEKARADLKNTQQQIKADQAAVDTARDKVKQAQAQLDLAQKNTRRILLLVKKKMLSAEKGDEAISNLKVAQANLNETKSQLKEALAKLGDLGEMNAQIRVAKAALAHAILYLSYTRVYAPADGFITSFELRNGSMVMAQQPLFALIENNKWWVDANFKEIQLEQIHKGQHADIHVDMYPHHTFKGIVENINRGSGAAFSIMPPENATGNWVKVTQRFTVKIIILKPDPKYPLRVGASSTVIIDATKL